ncbi:PREDICTED: uncharacterized protein C2orf78 homolog [Condylura cristata]|uniref:uncharacterized protein C2orf78 homolog n=1 Tax=Condylura cristata TaxID=143302 RepID=UPI0003344779|nr:PREDICTED: uncharacterized protein C2orf78 homolog [Condylura cristata]
MHWLVSATQTSSSVSSSSFVSAVDVSSSLTMSENFQNLPLLGTTNSLQLPLPMVSNAASLTGSVCNFSRVSTPAVSSAWLLPSASCASFQPLMGSAYLYQHSSTTMLSGVSGQSQISTSTASYPSVFEWDITGSTEKCSSSLGDFTVTVIDQDTSVSSMSMAAQYDKTSDTSNIVPLYPSLSASLVQGTPSQIPNQGHGLSLPYQEGSQVYYYNQGTLGPLLPGELGPCLQSYGSVSYTGSRGSVPQPEMVMVLKEVQPTNILPPASTSGIYYSVSAQPITETSFQVMETSMGMETSLGLQSSSQTFCLSQASEFPKSCSSRIQILESNPPSNLGDISVTAPVQSSGNLLALPPAPSQEQTESKNLDEIKTKLSKPLDDYQITIENQDPPLLPLEIPDIHQLLACIDPLGPEKQPTSENTDLGENSLSLEDQETLESEMESNNSFADIATLVEDIHLPQLFTVLQDLDQPKDSSVIEVKDIGVIDLNQLQEKSSVIKGSSDNAKRNKHKASEPISGAPKAKMQAKKRECLLGGEVVVCSAAVNNSRASVNTAKHSNSKPQKAASSRISKAKSHGQEKTKRTKENNSKKAEENKQAGNKIKAEEEKPNIPKMKRKKNQPELSQEAFKKPRSCLGMHMLESVQVFHALGKKSDKKTGLSSSRALGNSRNSKGPQPSPVIKPWLDTPREGKGPEKTHGKASKPDSSAEKEQLSPSQYELPPPGKVKLVPLPFPTVDKPQARPVSRRPQSLASHRPAVAYPARPGSTNSVQSTAVNAPRPTPASVTGPARPARPTSNNPIRPGLNNPTRPSVPQSAAPRPAPYKTLSCTSLQREPAPTAVTKLQSPPKSQTQFLLQDFCFQPIPWRKPNVPEPVMSKPITKEQRPEREAMKRQAQQERENAAKYTSLGKLQFFIEREKDMDISRYYGYAM